MLKGLRARTDVNDSTNVSSGFFSVGGSFWQVNREMAVGLCGPRALLMQLAHPLVAAGVAEHSGFRRNRLGRLYRTALAASAMSFGSGRAACLAADRISGCHRGVRGVLSERVGPFPAGTAYDANDPRLKLWVFATLIDSALLGHEIFVARLSPREREDYYRESRAMGRLLGIPADVMPASYASFAQYVTSMLSSEVLTVGRAAQEQVDSLFDSTLVGRLARTASFFSIGLLPAKLRAAYGFRWNERRRRRLQKLGRASQRIRPLLPDLLCVSPAASLAEWLRLPTCPGRGSTNG
jgi:uncharacterized protein (DUF2236 family)